jgi:hypothetical protein
VLPRENVKKAGAPRAGEGVGRFVLLPPWLCRSFGAYPPIGRVLSFLMRVTGGRTYSLERLAPTACGAGGSPGLDEVAVMPRARMEILVGAFVVST